MIVFPNCKLNLGLHILRKRADGFHDLATVFYPLPIQDALEIVRNPAGTDAPELTTSGRDVPGRAGDNICVKAYALLKNDFPELPPVKMHLHKVIPMGAGLGGGSADGAFALRLLNRQFHLGLSDAQLEQYALSLGSDCPFFIRNQPAIASSRGESLENINLDLSPYKIVIVNPGIHVNTGWAFSQLTPSPDRPSLKEMMALPPASWRDTLVNDFEAPVAAIHPEVATIRETLYSLGAVYASMTGSGSTVYGLFPQAAAPALAFPPHFFVKIV